MQELADSERDEEQQGLSQGPDCRDSLLGRRGGLLAVLSEYCLKSAQFILQPGILVRSGHSPEGPENTRAEQAERLGRRVGMVVPEATCTKVLYSSLHQRVQFM